SCEDFNYTFLNDYDGEAEDYLFTVIENCVALTDPTNITATNNNLCVGDNSTLTLNGGTTTDVSTLWFEGACADIAYAQEWQSSPTSVTNTTVNSSGGTLNVTSTNNDPMINMP